MNNLIFRAGQRNNRIVHDLRSDSTSSKTNAQKQEGTNRTALEIEESPGTTSELGVAKTLKRLGRETSPRTRE